MLFASRGIGAGLSFELGCLAAVMGWPAAIGRSRSRLCLLRRSVFPRLYLSAGALSPPAHFGAASRCASGVASASRASRRLISIRRLSARAACAVVIVRRPRFTGVAVDALPLDVSTYHRSGRRGRLYAWPPPIRRALRSLPSPRLTTGWRSVWCRRSCALSGDLLAKRAHQRQPAKLAAMEGHFQTERCAPLRIGGVPDPVARVTRYALEVPCGLSFLAASDLQAEVAGLDRFPRDLWPNVVVTHLAFQVMVGCGVAMLAAAGWYLFERWRRRRTEDGPLSRALLMALVACAPLGFVALEAGWVVTEAGRQPWVIYGILRTADAVTPVADVGVSLRCFTLLYATLLFIVVSVPAPARGRGSEHLMISLELFFASL